MLELSGKEYLPSGTGPRSGTSFEIALTKVGSKPIGLYGKFLVCGLLGDKLKRRLLRIITKLQINVNDKYAIMLFRSILALPWGETMP